MAIEISGELPKVTGNILCGACGWLDLTAFSKLVKKREKHYISSSHLGLIRCLTPPGVSVVIYAQTICDESGNPIQICLPHELSHGAMVKQPRIPVSDVLQALTFKYQMVLIARLANMADGAESL